MTIPAHDSGLLQRLWQLGEKPQPPIGEYHPDGCDCEDCYYDAHEPDDHDAELADYDADCEMDRRADDRMTEGEAATRRWFPTDKESEDFVDGVMDRMTEDER